MTDAIVDASKANSARVLFAQVTFVVIVGGLIAVARHAKVLALTKKFLLVGVLKSFTLHLLFGALGGLAAGTILWLAVRSERGER